MVQEFTRLPEEIRKNIPEILLASMNILNALVKDIRSVELANQPSIYLKV